MIISIREGYFNIMWGGGEGKETIGINIEIKIISLYFPLEINSFASLILLAVMVDIVGPY